MTENQTPSPENNHLLARASTAPYSAIVYRPAMTVVE